MLQAAIKVNLGSDNVVDYSNVPHFRKLRCYAEHSSIIQNSDNYYCFILDTKTAHAGHLENSLKMF